MVPKPKRSVMKMANLSSPCERHACDVWEIRGDDGQWRSVEPDFDPGRLQSIGDGLWVMPEPSGSEKPQLGKSVHVTLFRLATGLLLENGNPRPRQSSSQGWGERVTDDHVPGTEIYIDEKGNYVFRHIGAYHHLIDGTAKYHDGSRGTETTLTHPDQRIFHANGITTYPDGRSLDRRTGWVTDLGGNAQKATRKPDGDWDVSA